MMLNVCTITPDRNATTEGIISTYPDGVILENPYSRRRGERGLAGTGGRRCVTAVASPPDIGADCASFLPFTVRVEEMGDNSSSGGGAS